MASCCASLFIGKLEMDFLVGTYGKTLLILLRFLVDIIIVNKTCMSSFLKSIVSMIP